MSMFVVGMLVGMVSAVVGMGLLVIWVDPYPNGINSVTEKTPEKAADLAGDVLALIR